MNTIVFFWIGLPSFLKVFLLAMLPVTELRASIPIGILVYKMPVASVLLWSVLGDILPVIFIYFFLKWFTDILSKKSVFFEHFFSWWFGKVEKKFGHAYHHWGVLALIFFVALPLPGTGAWTGIVAAYLFKLPFKKSFLAIIIGALIAGLLVTLATLGIFNFIKFI